MQRFILLITILVVTTRSDHSTHQRSVIVDRIQYLYKLKNVVNERIWPSFTDEKYDLPLVYYTDTACYVVNPTEKFITLYQPTLISKLPRLTIYKSQLLDSIPFHMATGVTFGSDTVSYDYKSPFMSCSSLEITKKTIPDVNTTELWATMVLHEYFHGFQFKHEDFLNFFQEDIIFFPEDSLRKIYETHRWYKEIVDKENNLLLSALSTNNIRDIDSLLHTFFQVRERRRKKTKQLLGVDLKSAERVYETMEGTARYIEYSLYKAFATQKPDSVLLQTDTTYRSYSNYQFYTIEKDPWLYHTEKTASYFYATGFNIIRLLDKLEIAYKSRLFIEGKLTSEDLLKHR